MQAIRIKASNDALLDPASSAWAAVKFTAFDMMPTPLAMVESASPFLAISTDHGAIKHLDVAFIHNGSSLAVALRWASARHDQIKELNQFVDGVAVMFPLARTSIAMTMGAKGAPVNAWLWRANKPAPFCVIAEGFAATRRLPADEAGDLAASAHHDGSRWTVIMRRSLQGPDGHARLVPGQSTRVAFAVWDGGNAERSGRKSFSGDFIDLELAR
ncbi:ethylbenzene dehydrogenase-related protein [Aquabacterium sp.]|uniref:ethylbenzene dehydrogenase-related protein n=1 Tax=Aquabacterium sp. TaxID=1872578 RepID=UPI0035AFF3AA